MVDDAAGPRAATLSHRLKDVARQNLSYRRRSALRMLISFIVTFGLIRLLTYAIHRDLGPFHDVVIGGGANGSLHIHHYVWGILLLAVCGFLALSLDAPTWHPILAIPFGIGLALVIDEFALLLQLKDVYWAQQGRVSVDVGILATGLLALYYFGQRFWHALARELGRGFGRGRGSRSG